MAPLLVYCGLDFFLWCCAHPDRWADALQVLPACVMAMFLLPRTR